MAKCRRIDEAEFDLPQEIIQHIQSFLSGIDAAETTILSKSWYGAWLTRPNLDFNQNFFRNKDEFWKFVVAVVQRYEESNLKILSFKLEVHDFNPLIYELIQKVMKMGAIDLDLEIKFHSMLSIPFSLPHDVLGSENLERLSLNGCKMGVGEGEDRKIRCWRLKSLNLCHVVLDCTDNIWNVILFRFPLLENLSLSNCIFYRLSDFEKLKVGEMINPCAFGKLKCLLLNEVNIHTLFFDDFSSKFPCLKDLTVNYCYGYKAIRISSPSLECINFKHEETLRVKFDVPSVRKFTFWGRRIPSLSFRAATSNWESDISIAYCYSPSATWFLTLNKLLKNLSHSKISLFLDIYLGKGFDFDPAGKFQGLPKPVVEKLTIDVQDPCCPAIFNSLFHCCRPLFLHSKSTTQLHGVVKMVYKGLKQQISLNNSCTATDLKDFIVEYFDEDVSAWQLLPSGSLYTAATEAGKKIRFQLRWD